MKFYVSLLLLSLSSFASLKIGTFNIRNFDMRGTQTNKALLEKELKELDVDLLAVQEIVNVDSFGSFISDNFPQYKLVLSKCGGSGKQKLGFIYNPKKLNLTKSYEELSISSVGGSRCESLRPGFVGLFTTVETNKEIVAISLHLKAGSGSRNFARRNQQYNILADLKKELAQKGHQNIVFMGDLNTTGYMFQDEDYTNFQALLSSANMKTISKNIQCTSYWSGMDRNDGIEEASLLDHIVLSENFLNSSPRNIEVGGHCKKTMCKNTDLADLGKMYEEVSDHCPLTFEIND